VTFPWLLAPETLVLVAVLLFLLVISLMSLVVPSLLLLVRGLQPPVEPSLFPLLPPGPAVLAVLFRWPLVLQRVEAAVDLVCQLVRQLVAMAVQLVSQWGLEIQARVARLL
jgi:hypothetical protein